MSKQIPLTQGQFAIVDDDDFEIVKNHKWCIHHGYAVSSRGIRMHRLIMNCPDSKEVDHINRNRLDNRKENLRICTRTENCRNRGENKDNTSGYKGVNFHKPLGKWRAKIVLNNKHIHLGYFDNPKDAARAYNDAAKKNGFGFLNEI